MRSRKTIAAAGMAAALAGGLFIGATLGNPLASGASGNAAATTTTTAPNGGSPKPHDGPGGHHGGFGLETAAKTLHLTTDELRKQLQAGKSLADVAKAQGVPKQTLIDALVKDGEARLDKAKAALPDEIAKMVDATPPKGGPGGMGRPGGMGGPGGMGDHHGPGLDAAAKAIGISADDLQTQLRAGKTLAAIAKSKGVSAQKVIDAMVAEAKAKSAAAVKAGKITQAEADQHLAEITKRITSFVNDGFGAMHGPGGMPGGMHGPGDMHGPGGMPGGMGGPDGGPDGQGGQPGTPGN